MIFLYIAPQAMAEAHKNTLVVHTQSAHRNHCPEKQSPTPCFRTQRHAESAPLPSFLSYPNFHLFRQFYLSLSLSQNRKLVDPLYKAFHFFHIRMIRQIRPCGSLRIHFHQSKPPFLQKRSRNGGFVLPEFPGRPIRCHTHIIHFTVCFSNPSFLGEFSLPKYGLSLRRFSKAKNP